MPDSFKIPIKNVTSGRKGVKDYRSFYDNKSKELVAEFFAEEINALGYSFWFKFMLAHIYLEKFLYYEIERLICLVQN